MEFMNQIEDRLLDELKELSQKLGNGEEMTSQCLDDIKDITSSLNHITTYTAMKNSGYSQESGMSRGGQRRDGMGRYSMRGAGYSRNGYGRMMDDWDRGPYEMY